MFGVYSISNTYKSNIFSVVVNMPVIFFTTHPVVGHVELFLFFLLRLSASSRIAHLLPEEQVYLNQQSGTIRLDCFTHCLIVKCAPDITVSPLSHLSCSLTIFFTFL